MTPTGNSVPRCPVCRSVETEAVLERTGFPVMQNIVYLDRAGAQAAPRGDIRLVVCRTCGFVFNAAFDGERVAYGIGYDNTIPDSPAFRAHLERRSDVVAEAVPADAHVVDVGCGDGAFLKAIVERRPAVVGIGIDAAYAGPATVGDRLRFERRFFGGSAELVEADALVCRHVIEHLPDPLAFLAAVHAGLVARSPGARVFFETPALEWILEQGAIWDVFYEHCNYFSEGALRRLFTQAGFTLTRMERVFDRQYHWIEATVGVPSAGVQSDGAPIATAMRAFGAYEQQARTSLHERLAAAAKDGPVALWGAAAKGVTLANLVDPGGDLLLGVVDRNTAKQGSYLPVSGHRVLAPAALAECDVALVLVANPQYVEENRQLARALGAKTRVEALH
jgi:SAM-dependent methyltransferase